MFNPLTWPPLMVWLLQTTLVAVAYLSMMGFVHYRLAQLYEVHRRRRYSRRIAIVLALQALMVIGYMLVLQVSLWLVGNPSLVATSVVFVLSTLPLLVWVAYQWAIVQSPTKLRRAYHLTAPGIRRRRSDIDVLADADALQPPG